MTYRVGIDTGGTFTDLVALDETTGEVSLAKVMSNPAQPALALLAALETAQIPLHQVQHLIHGTTVATNALLERTGAQVAYVTTAGFEDVPFIQRIRREYHYDLMWSKPEPLVARQRCFGIEERVDYRGEVVTPLRIESLDDLIRQGEAGAFETIAICYLFAYLNAEHEQATLAHVQRTLPDMPISLSTQIAPIWREYERASTTIADAYLRPLMTRYTADLSARLAEHGLRNQWSLMKSNGGVMPAHAVADNAVQTILSGPAGGMIACTYFAQLSGDAEVVTLDMGGTSCDVGLLVAGVQRYTTEFEIEWGIPINVPLIDIKTIGAGGGSIAWLDAGGLLHVGPQSAGAQPGPICYNQGGTRPTVTDANAILGRVVPDRFMAQAGGAAMLRAEAAVADVGVTMGLDQIDAALAIIEIANANMIDAIKLITLEQGLDPRRFALIAFGGAGPLHAASIARGLNMRRVVIPPHPGMCSALGMLVTDLRVDRVMTFPATSQQVSAQMLLERYQEMIATCQAELVAEGYVEAEDGRLVAQMTASMRYLGQNYEEDIGVQLAELQAGETAAIFDRFHQHHKERYGYDIRDEVIELVALKVTLVGVVQKPSLMPSVQAVAAEVDRDHRAYFRDFGWVTCPIYRREGLALGTELVGPAIVEEHGATTLLEPGQRLVVDGHGMLVIELDPSNAEEL